MGWSFEMFGEKFYEKQVTLDQYIDLEDRLSTPDVPVSWGAIHPLRSAKHGKYVAARVYADRTGMSFDEAMTKVGALGAVDFIDAVDLIDTEDDEEVRDPLDPPLAGQP